MQPQQPDSVKTTRWATYLSSVLKAVLVECRTRPEADAPAAIVLFLGRVRRTAAMAGEPPKVVRIEPEGYAPLLLFTL